MSAQALTLAVLLGFMAALAVVETWIPLRTPGRRSLRWRANLGLAALFFLVNLALNAAVLGIAAWFAQRQIGLFRWFELPSLPAFILGIAVLDLFAYLVHVLMHRIPAFWRLHRVHHSDAHVDVTTTFRQHPLETILRFIFTFAPAFAFGVSPAAVASYRLLSGVNALFEHANLRMNATLERFISTLLVTPNMHKIHHSRHHVVTDSNYGNLLTWFDRAFGTYTPVNALPGVTYGLDDVRADRQRFADLIKLPWAA
jgi:sterol desaturase/sphingolipid hydroxylase (fatty acid hydroxylase superfamily)